MKIVRSIVVRQIVGSVKDDVLNMIGPDHPKMTNKEREIKAAQRHIVELFMRQLLEAWPTAHGPQFGICDVRQNDYD